MGSLSGVDDVEGFEGAEKALELEFEVAEDDALGLRRWSRSVWDHLLSLARCAILDVTSNEAMDAYILSESSLFVYRHQLIVKTCGRTTLLEMLPDVLDTAKKDGLSAIFILYRRKNLLWPEQQICPHGDPHKEEEFINQFFDNGEGFIIGPPKGDHWYLYIADNSQPPYTEAEQTLEIMMHECDSDALRPFFNQTGDKDARHVTETTGIAGLLPGSLLHEYLFSPCGYSMNGMLGKSYWTIHVTPESHCSYASFETNVPLRDYTDLIRSVLHIFRPNQAIVALTADFASPLDHSSPFLPTALCGYKLRNKFTSTFEGDYHCLTCRYRKEALTGG
uniref:S-adenosylmethionine decarboxylase proenzyme n=1 Tax=Vitrella brassicaformis TaxID=1169539 RepID=A0A7S1PE01_9ALVE|mmetsp:Transcript_7828/g.19257  ORF Transcript_7828/g.19257 Transcript_7828/m.19257 type:complete len:335 (+) Transcript_7828:298-1302(+)